MPTLATSSLMIFSVGRALHYYCLCFLYLAVLQNTWQELSRAVRTCKCPPTATSSRPSKDASALAVLFDAMSPRKPSTFTSLQMALIFKRSRTGPALTSASCAHQQCAASMLAVQTEAVKPHTRAEHAGRVCAQSQGQDLRSARICTDFNFLRASTMRCVDAFCKDNRSVVSGG